MIVVRRAAFPSSLVHSSSGTSSSGRALQTLAGVSSQLGPPGSRILDHGSSRGPQLTQRAPCVPAKVSLLLLRQTPFLSHTLVCFLMTYAVAVHCMCHQGASRSLLLLQLSENLFKLASRHFITLSVVHLLGHYNIDARRPWWSGLYIRMPARIWSTSSACPRSTCLLACPTMSCHSSWIGTFPLLPGVRMPSWWIGTGGCVCTCFPLLCLRCWSRCVSVFVIINERVLLIAPLWRAQPWCTLLLRWCPHLLPFTCLSVVSPGLPPSLMSFAFHACSFWPSA